MDNISSVPDMNGEKSKSSHDEYSRHYQNVGSVTIPKEIFEAFYPRNSHHQQRRVHTRHIFGNAFPMPLMGFLMASTPLGCTLMGWRGAGGNGAALVGVFYFFGGMLQIIGCVLEWINGNTFPFVVFASYGAFWLSLGATFQPDYNAMGAYVKAGESAAAKTAGMDTYYNTYAFFYMIMTVLTFLYLLASVRTNIVLFIVFLFIDCAFFMLMSSYWVLAEGRTTVGTNLQIAAGAFVFAFCMFGWYLFFSLILESLDFPFSLPLIDLSGRVLRKRRERDDSEDQAAEVVEE